MWIQHLQEWSKTRCGTTSSLRSTRGEWHRALGSLQVAHLKLGAESSGTHSSVQTKAEGRTVDIRRSYLFNRLVTTVNCVQATASAACSPVIGQETSPNPHLSLISMVNLHTSRYRITNLSQSSKQTHLCASLTASTSTSTKVNPKGKPRPEKRTSRTEKPYKTL